MRTVVNLICLVASAVYGFGQPTVEFDFTNANAELLGTTSRLQYVKGLLITIGQNGRPPIDEGAIGTVTFTTPSFRSGDTTQGGAFGAGGTFFISTPFTDASVTATFVSGTWRILTLQNGTHYYILKARIKGTMFFQGANHKLQGVTTQLSTNTGKDLFGGSFYMSGGSTSVVFVP
jgi:hypothetical protein